MTDLTWQDHALCRGMHQLFDGPEDLRQPLTVEQRRTQRLALALCRICPVLTQCHTWALHTYRDTGPVVGGMTGYDRRRLRARYWHPAASTIGMPEKLGGTQRMNILNNPS